MLQTPFKPHPVIAAPSEAQIRGIIEKYGSDAPAKMQEIERKRLEAMQLMETDQFNHGYVIPAWREAKKLLDEPGVTLLSLFGGNGAAKTVFSVWDTLRFMVTNPGSKCLFLHESETSSNMTHQKFVYDYLPLEWKPTELRRVKKTLTTKINYSLADGFTNNILTLPNGSLAQFGFYGQDVGGYEGGGWHRIVADENLPLNWLKTLLFRLPRLGGKMIWTYTPVDGVTLAVKHVVEGARTLTHRRAELLAEDHRASEMQDWPPGHMPVTQEGVDDAVRIMYFFSSDNPFAGYEQMKRGVGKLTRLDIERRFYGYARNTVRALFPLFGRPNIIAHSKIPAANVTRYHVLDPAGARNMFQIWCAIDDQGRHFIYREWPDVETLGEWAVPAQKARLRDGEAGPAQPSLGYGTLEYKRLILSAEGNRFDPRTGWEMKGEQIFQRLIDPRSGRAESMAEHEGSSSIIDRFQQEQMTPEGIIEGPSLLFEQASGQREEHGIIAINDLLAYDPTQPVTSLLNEPSLYVSERCKNLIWCLMNYTGTDGEKAASKDPIDCLRYLCLEKLQHHDARVFDGYAGGSY